MGRVEIPIRKWISNSSSPVPPTYQGCLQYYWGHFGEGPGVWGEGSVFDPLMAGKFAIYNRHQPLNRLGSLFFFYKPSRVCLSGSVL